MNKIKVAILGTGNIGTDILIKVRKSPILECTLFTGRNINSKGIQLAKQLGIMVSTNSINSIIEQPECCDIVFDATSADAHKRHTPILANLKKFVIDLTPSNICEVAMCIPIINLNDCLSKDDVNLVTCGGQSGIPIIHEIVKSGCQVDYIELVASISSKSAGIATRDNIDEFTQKTKDAIIKFTNISRAKAIIILNPAEPPVKMRTTVYVICKNPNMELITNNILRMEHEMQRFVPGYKIIMQPVYENGRISVIIEVTGKGDYLPSYAGNLDIITCAAVEVAEAYAYNRINNGGKKID